MEKLLIKSYVDEKDIFNLNLEKYLNEIAELRKSEFINGEIEIHSPACKTHIYASGNIFKILSQHVLNNDLGVMTQEKAAVQMQIGTNIYEPDLCFFSKDKEHKYLKGEVKIFPVPDIAMEILSETSIKRDREIKFRDYARNGIPEYWIIDTEQKTVELWILDNTYYILSKIFENEECITSSVIKNLRVPINVFFSNELASEYIKLPFLKEIEKQKLIINKAKDALVQKDEIINQKDEIINQKDEIINQTKEQLVQKEAELKYKEDLISEMKRQLEKLQNKVE